MEERCSHQSQIVSCVPCFWFSELRTEVALRFIDPRSSVRFTQGDVRALCAGEGKAPRSGAFPSHLFLRPSRHPANAQHARYAGPIRRTLVSIFLSLPRKTARLINTVITQDLFGERWYQYFCHCPGRQLVSLTLSLRRTYSEMAVLAQYKSFHVHPVSVSVNSNCSSLFLFLRTENCHCFSEPRTHLITSTPQKSQEHQHIGHITYGIPVQITGT